MINTSVIRERFAAVSFNLTEQSRRLFAAAEAKTAGHGGITAVSLATGIARSTIGRGLKDLAAPDPLPGEVRRPGGGSPSLIRSDPTLLDDLRRLVEPATMGDPMRPLMWVSKSRAKLAAALQEMGHKNAANSVPKLLGMLNYSRQVRWSPSVGQPGGHVKLGSVAIHAASLVSSSAAAQASSGVRPFRLECGLRPL